MTRFINGTLIITITSLSNDLKCFPHFLSCDFRVHSSCTDLHCSKIIVECKKINKFAAYLEPLKTALLQSSRIILRTSLCFDNYRAMCFDFIFHAEHAEAELKT